MHPRVEGRRPPGRRQAGGGAGRRGRPGAAPGRGWGGGAGPGAGGRGNGGRGRRWTLCSGGLPGAPLPSRVHYCVYYRVHYCVYYRVRHCCVPLSLSLSLSRSVRYRCWQRADPLDIAAAHRPPVLCEDDWTIVTMSSTHVTIYHHLISQAGWNRSNISIYLFVSLGDG